MYTLNESTFPDSNSGIIINLHMQLQKTTSKKTGSQTMHGKYDESFAHQDYCSLIHKNSKRIARDAMRSSRCQENRSRVFPTLSKRAS